MTYAACAVSVESMLKAQPGVLDVIVSYPNRSAEVAYQAGVINFKKMQKAVSQIGYELLPDTAHAVAALVATKKSTI